jgi:hypothetical protein
LTRRAEIDYPTGSLLRKTQRRCIFLGCLNLELPDSFTRQRFVEDCRIMDALKLGLIHKHFVKSEPAASIWKVARRRRVKEGLSDFVRTFFVFEKSDKPFFCFQK